MNRQDEIIEAAKNDTIVYTERDRAMFLEGAQWADDHPDIDVRTMAAWKSGYKEAIERACEWLQGRLPLTNLDEFIDEFKKAMKGD